MQKVAVVTDSVACLNKEHTAQYGIQVVPIKILFEDRVYHNGVDLTPSEAYKLLAKAPDYFATSPSSPSDYTDVFREIAVKGRDIFCITVSSKLSTTFSVACLAKDIIKQEQPHTSISVMDSKNATASQGFIALAAARAAARGNTLDGVIKEASAVRDRVQFLLALETIRHAYRTGRIPKIATQMGSLLGVKPLLTISGGVVRPISVVRSKKRGVERMIINMRRKVGNNPVHVAVMHTDAPKEAEKLEHRISDEFNCVELFTTEVSPIIGYSVGPGALGLAFYTDL